MFSVWLRNNQPTSWNNAIKTLFQLRVGAIAVLSLSTASVGRLQMILLNDVGNPTAFYASGTSTQFQLNRWYHVMGAWTPTGVKIWVDGVERPGRDYAALTMAGQTITQLGVGATTVAGGVWTGDIGHLWLSVNQTLDLSVQANREKFILAGAPVDLELNGSGPTGTAPEWYYDGNAPDWINQGTGPSGTLVGALTASSTAPGL